MFNSSGSPRVKFIDIDQFSFKGDYIYDFGELISDLEVVSYLQNQICFSLPSNQFEYQLELPEAVTAAIETIWKEVENELQQDDPHWKSRLYLAKARYLFSVVANSSQFKNDFPLAFVTFCEGLRELQNAMDAI
jgi:5-methylthioribose kinase